MRKTRLLLIGAALVAACTPSHTRTAAPLTFIQMSDPQFGMFAADSNFTRETLNFTKAIEDANHVRPSFVIITGDLVNREGDAAQIAEYRRISALLDPAIKLYSMPGNHDVGNTPTPQLLAAYRTAVGADYYSFRAGPMTGIVLNSSLIKDPSGAPDAAKAQDAWLRGALQQARDARTHIFIFMHHSWFIAKEDEPDQYFNIPLVRRRVYLQLFRDFGVTHLFSGHYHRNALAGGNGLEMITTGPVGKPLGPDPSGMRIVRVVDGRVEHRYVSLDSIH
jgi:serine/threonine-protein phosphatase CPPED1